MCARRRTVRDGPRGGGAWQGEVECVADSMPGTRAARRAPSSTTRRLATLRRGTGLRGTGQLGGVRRAPVQRQPEPWSALPWPCRPCPACHDAGPVSPATGHGGPRCPCPRLLHSQASDSAVALVALPSILRHVTPSHHTTATLFCRRGEGRGGSGVTRVARWLSRAALAARPVSASRGRNEKCGKRRMARQRAGRDSANRASHAPKQVEKASIGARVDVPSALVAPCEQMARTSRVA